MLSSSQRFHLPINGIEPAFKAALNSRSLAGCAIIGVASGLPAPAMWITKVPCSRANRQHRGIRKRVTVQLSFDFMPGTGGNRQVVEILAMTILMCGPIIS